MGEWNLDRAYHLLLEEGYATGQIRRRTDGPDHRSAPRFRLHDGQIAVRVEPQFQLVDISAAGFAFYSEFPFQPDTLVQVILKDTVAYRARVVASPLVETDAGLMELRYRVQCRFDDISNGKQFLVFLKEMEHFAAEGPQG